MYADFDDFLTMNFPHRIIPIVIVFCIVTDSNTAGCPAGFTLLPDGQCLDIDECAGDEQGDCQTRCINLPGSFQCECDVGFRLSPNDQKTCEDIDECLLRNGRGPCQSKCTNTPGSYRCSCDGGKFENATLSQDGHTCMELLKQCESEKKCSHGCIETHGRVFCTCPDGLELGSDWKTCRDIDECQEPKVVKSCQYGCVNLIGTYACNDNNRTYGFLNNVISNERAELENYDDDDYESEEYEDYEEEENVSKSDGKLPNETNKKEHDDYVEEDYDDEDYKEDKERSSKNKETDDRRFEEQDQDVTSSPPLSSVEQQSTTMIVTTETYNVPESTKTTPTKEEEYTTPYKEKEQEKDDATEKNYVDQTEAPDYTILLEKTTVKEVDDFETDAKDNVTIAEHYDNKDELKNISTAEDTIDEDENGYDPLKKEIDIVNLVTEDKNTQSERKHFNVSTPNTKTTFTTEPPKESKKETIEDDYDGDDYEDEDYDNDLEKSLTERPQNKTRIDENKEIDENSSPNVIFTTLLETSTVTTEKTTKKEDSPTPLETTTAPAKTTESDDDVVDEDYSDEDYDDNSEERPTILTTFPEISTVPRVGITEATTTETSSTTDYVLKKESSNRVDNDLDDYSEEKYDKENEEQITNNTEENKKPDPVCPVGFQYFKVLDLEECIDINECITEKNPCLGTDLQCENTIGSYKCLQKVPECPTGYKVNYTLLICEDIDECTKNPCNQICMNTEGSYKCSCNDGFVLSSLDNYSCSDIDECLLDDTHNCSHMCENSLGSYRCICNGGYHLENDGTCTDIDECLERFTNNCEHVCLNVPGSYKCDCRPGFEISVDHSSCHDIDECQQSPCDHTCTNSIGSYTCSCNDGHMLQSDNRTCHRVDWCMENNGGCSHFCHFSNDSRELWCSCPEHYYLKNKTCHRVAPCLENNGGCSHECHSINDGQIECSCPEGHQLDSSLKQCVQIDPCMPTNGGCSHFCSKVTNSEVKCSCPLGYTLGSDDRTCTEVIVDKCLQNNGGCSHDCVTDNKGLVKCSCPGGYQLDATSKHCVQVDPCSFKNGNCSHFCSVLEYHAKCSCPLEYTLGSDERTCVFVDKCSVSNGGCSHFCHFSADSREHWCSCPEHFSLKNKTCHKIDPCLDKNGGCSHECHSNSENEVKCSCPPEYTLKPDERTCAQIFVDKCLVNNGGCSHLCHFSSNSGEHWCSCPEHYYLKDKTCHEVDPCLNKNGGCSHECHSNDGGQIECSCPLGYTLGPNGRICSQVPVDKCALDNGGCSHLCHFNAKSGDHWCSCPEHYYLKDKTCHKVNPCLVKNGGCSHECHSDDEGNVKCSCPEELQLDTTSRNCVQVDPCATTKNGGCSHFCSPSSDGQKVKCSCPTGYTLRPDERTCAQVLLDKCSVANGGCSHLCHFSASSGEHWCSCPEHYYLKGRTCHKVDPCLVKNGGCSHRCHSDDEGEIKCSCPEGLQLDPSAKHCVQVDPCTIKNGGCSHICLLSSENQVKCSCPQELILGSNGSTCVTRVLADKCSINNGGCSHFCTVKSGHVKCSCPVGYILKPNKRTCKEINECRINRGGCSHYCKNTIGSYECLCPKGYDLTNNKKCTKNHLEPRTKTEPFAIKCPILNPPASGNVRCINLSDKGTKFVPIGTRCVVWCQEGYKLSGGDSVRECRNGTWGQEPQCVASYCPKLLQAFKTPHVLKHGWFLPKECNEVVQPGQKCRLNCKGGYRARKGFEIFWCDQRTLQWEPRTTIYNEDLCIRDVPPYIRCPKGGHMTFILPPGQRHIYARIPKPESNINFNHIISDPIWGIHLGTTLPAGRTEVTFYARDPLSEYSHRNRTSCKLSINVLDQENPSVSACPDNMEFVLDRGYRERVVSWNEPQFRDNVAVSSIYKSKIPGTRFEVGLHHVNYVASDEAGNRAFCHFTINIKEGQPEYLSTNSLNGYSGNSYGGPHRYRAVLICPSGVQYMSQTPDQYNNHITSEAGCYWKHVLVNRPIQPLNYRIPLQPNKFSTTPLKINKGSILPPDLQKNKRRKYFDWYEKL